VAASRLTAAALAALALAACNDNRAGMAGGGSSGSGLCTPFAGQTTAANAAAAPVGAPADPAAAVDDCLHHWGYALAASSDPANQVADAVVAACTSTLARWNQQAMMPAVPGAPAPPGEAPSLVTGETTTPTAERHAYAEGRALFYVVQARAGKCSAPPMKDGAMAGATAPGRY
jgi:hypothetical protein